MSQKQLPTLGHTYMSLSQAQRLAQETANETNSPVIVYKSKLHDDFEDYDVAYTLPAFGIRIGDPILPQKKEVSTLCELSTTKRSSESPGHLQASIPAV
jgi:hypothetical protein